MIPSAARAALARLSRLTATVLLLLAVISNPVLAAVGDTLEAGRGVAGHLHEAHAASDGANAGDEADLSDLLHALVHAAHCCGHLTAVLPALPLPLEPLGLGGAPESDPRAAPSPRLAFPTRPPILV